MNIQKPKSVAGIMVPDSTLTVQATDLLLSMIYDSPNSTAVLINDSRSTEQTLRETS